MLDTLTRGVMDQSIGNISFSLAEKHAETYKFYEENKNGALFQFNLVIYGMGQAADSVASSLYGQLNSASERQISMKFNKCKSHNLNTITIPKESSSLFAI